MMQRKKDRHIDDQMCKRPHRYTEGERGTLLEQQRTRDKQHDERVNELRVYGLQNHVNDMEVRTQDKIELRAQGVLRRQQEMHESMLRAQQEKQIFEDQQRQEDSLASELKRIQILKERDEKMRQQIRESSIELREFEQQLKAAYVQKELCAQMIEKRALKMDDIEREKEYRRIIEEDVKKGDEEERRVKMEKVMFGDQYRGELNVQLKELETKKQLELDEHMKDKLLVDEVVRKMYFDDQAEMERKCRLKEKIRKEIEENLLTREKFKRMEVEREQEDLAHLTDYAHELQIREAATKKRKREEDEARQILLKQLGEQLTEAHFRNEEAEMIRMTLAIEEQEAREHQREMEGEELACRKKAEMWQAFHDCMSNKIQRKEMDRQQEEVLKKQMADRLAELDFEEFVKKEERLKAKIEFKKSIQALIEERANLVRSDRAREMDRLRELVKMADMQTKIVEEERAKLLREHAPNLLGYLPKNVIRDETDLDLLGPEYREAYSVRRADPAEFFRGRICVKK